jgi:hypothetical protein
MIPSIVDPSANQALYSYWIKSHLYSSSIAHVGADAFVRPRFCPSVEEPALSEAEGVGFHGRVNLKIFPYASTKGRPTLRLRSRPLLPTMRRGTGLRNDV